MNVQEIIDEITKDIDNDTIDNSVFIGWINRCIDDLTPLAKKEDLKTADIAAENSYSVPDDLLEVFMVLVNGCQYYPVRINEQYKQGYKLWGNVLSLQCGPDTGEIELYYYKRLSHVASVTDTPEIDAAFHDLFVLYTTAYNQYSEHGDDWAQRQGDALNRYNQRKQDFTNYIINNSFETKSQNSINTAYFL